MHCRRINTGLYVGARQAWELYITRLAICLEKTSEIRDLIDAESVPETSYRIGCFLAGVFSVNSFMLAAAPVC